MLSRGQDSPPSGGHLDLSLLVAGPWADMMRPAVFARCRNLSATLTLYPRVGDSPDMGLPRLVQSMGSADAREALPSRP